MIADSTIGGGREAALCADKFGRENVCGTLSVTPCWCYGSETMDLDPTTVKGGLGFQRHRTAGRGVSGGGHGGACPEGLPASPFMVMTCRMPTTVRFRRCAGKDSALRPLRHCGRRNAQQSLRQHRCDCDGHHGQLLRPGFLPEVFSIRAEWVDMSEIIRRVNLEIYDHEEYERA